MTRFGHKLNYVINTFVKHTPVLDNKYSYLLTLCVNDILNHVISYSVSEQNIDKMADPHGQVCLFKSFCMNKYIYDTHDLATCISYIFIDTEK